MFHWICPECGRETAPTERECPACEGLEQAELVLAGVVEASASTSSSDAGILDVNRSEAGSKGGSPGSVAGRITGHSQIQEGSAASRNGSSLSSRTEDEKSQGVAEEIKGVAEEIKVAAEQEVTLDAGKDIKVDAEKDVKADAQAETPAAEPVAAADAVTELSHAPSLVGLAELARNTALSSEAVNTGEAAGKVADAAPVADVPASHDLQLRLDAAAKVLAEASETALIPEIIDPATFVSHMMEAKSSALLGASAQAPEQVVRSIRTKTLESRSVESRSVESRSVDARSVDARSVDARSVDARLVDTWTVASKPSATKYIDARPVGASSVDAQPVAENHAAPAIHELPRTAAAPVDSGADVVASAAVEPGAAKSEEGNATPSQAVVPVPFSRRMNRVLQAAGVDIRGRRGRSAANLPPAPHKLLAAPSAPVAPKQESIPQEPPPVETSAVSANVENADSSLAEPAVVSGAEIAEQARLVLPEQTLPEPAPTSTASLRALDSAVSPTGAEEKIEEKIEGKIEDKIAENVSSALETCVPENVADPSASLSVAQPVAETATAPTPAESVSPEPSAGEPAAAEPKTDATSLELLAEGLPLHGKMTMRANTPVAAPFAVAAPLAIAGPPEPYLLAAPSQDHKAQDHKAQDHKAMIESAPLASQLTRPKREPALVKVQMRLTMPVAPVVANNPAQSMVLEVEVAPQKDLAQAPDLPARFPSPRMGRLLRYSPVAKRTIVPAAPSREPLKSSVEVMGTIPAPMLPAALVSFKDPGLRPQFLEQAVLRKSSSWGQLFLVALLGIGLGLGVHYLYVSYMHPPEADADVAEDSAPASTPAAAVASSPGNGFTKSMEVTGFRIVVDPTRKTEIHYIVVNHSGVRFPDAKVSVTLYSTDARVGQPPLCHFSFAVPNLGPFEAKEMVSSLESSPAGNPPEWRDLRAEVSIGQ